MSRAIAVLVCLLLAGCGRSEGIPSRTVLLQDCATQLLNKDGTKCEVPGPTFSEGKFKAIPEQQTVVVLWTRKRGEETSYVTSLQRCSVFDSLNWVCFGTQFSPVYSMRGGTLTVVGENDNAQVGRVRRSGFDAVFQRERD